MPSLIHRSLRRRALCAVVAMVSLAAPSVASACTVPDTPESQPFLGIGDDSSYILAPDGTFASGAAGWTLDGATVQSDSVNVPGVDVHGTRALEISAGGSAISPPVCIVWNEPTIRFLERSPESETASMTVSVNWGLLGIPLAVPVGAQPADSGWSASPIYALALAAPTSLIGATVPARIEFHAIGAPVRIDGLFVDPYSRG